MRVYRSRIATAIFTGTIEHAVGDDTRARFPVAGQLASGQEAKSQTLCDDHTSVNTVAELLLSAVAFVRRGVRQIWGAPLPTFGGNQWPRSPLGVWLPQITRRRGWKFELRPDQGPQRSGPESMGYPWRGMYIPGYSNRCYRSTASPKQAVSAASQLSQAGKYHQPWWST